MSDLGAGSPDRTSPFGHTTAAPPPDLSRLRQTSGQSSSSAGRPKRNFASARVPITANSATATDEGILVVLPPGIAAHEVRGEHGREEHGEPHRTDGE